MALFFGNSDARAALEAAQRATSLPCSVEKQGRGSEQSLVIVVDGSGDASPEAVEPGEVPLISSRILHAAQAVSNTRVAVSTVDRDGRRHSWSTIHEATYVPSPRGVTNLCHPGSERSWEEPTGVRTEPDATDIGDAAHTLLWAQIRFVEPMVASVRIVDVAASTGPLDLVDLTVRHLAKVLFDLGPSTPAPELVEAMGLFGEHMLRPARGMPAGGHPGLGVQVVESDAPAIHTRTVRLVRVAGGLASVVAGREDDESTEGTRLYATRSAIALALAAGEHMTDERCRTALGQAISAMVSEYLSGGPDVWCARDNVDAVPMRGQALAFETVGERGLL